MKMSRIMTPELAIKTTTVGIHGPYQIEPYGSIIVKRLGIANPWIQGHSIAREVALQNRAADLGLAPRVLEFDESQRYLVMEYVDGVTLADFQGTPQEKEALVQKADVALTKLHAADICHGDTHMYNVMVRRSDGAIQLIDFETAHEGEGGCDEHVGLSGGLTAPRRVVRDRVANDLTNKVADRTHARLEAMKRQRIAKEEKARRDVIERIMSFLV